MKKEISSKRGISIIIFFSVIISIIIVFNVLNFKISSSFKEQRDFEVTDFLSDELFCDILYNEIKDFQKESNFCEEDDDCKALALIINHTRNDCYYYINKDIDDSIFYTKLSDYGKRCTDMIDDCEPSLEVACVNKKCVYIGDN